MIENIFLNSSTITIKKIVAGTDGVPTRNQKVNQKYPCEYQRAFVCV